MAGQVPMMQQTQLMGALFADVERLENAITQLDHGIRQTNQLGMFNHQNMLQLMVSFDSLAALLIDKNLVNKEELETKIENTMKQVKEAQIEVVKEQMQEDKEEVPEKKEESKIIVP